MGLLGMPRNEALPTYLRTSLALHGRLQRPMNRDSDRSERDAAVRFIRSLNRFTFLAAISLGTSAALALLLLRWNGLLDANEYSSGRIFFIFIMSSVVFPSALCSAFWLISLEESHKWFERLGFVLLFIVIPAMVMVFLFRYFSGR